MRSGGMGRLDIKILTIFDKYELIIIARLWFTIKHLFFHPAFPGINNFASGHNHSSGRIIGNKHLPFI